MTPALRVRFSQTEERRDIFCLALKVEVTRAQAMTPKIFVYHQSPVGPLGNTYSEFDHVASPVDLHEIPEDQSTERVPYYRSDKVVVWFRCMDDLVNAKQMFVDDIGALQRSVGLLTGDNNFTNQSDVDFGTLEEPKAPEANSTAK